ncbi:hypothetical protein [Paenibacillus sp. FSL K6-2859]|uniref:hypothetical protein n=1 Tax=Paenibacillus sp. FSL K6-2859 TaxID=2921482 RepID=UPI0030FC22F9
MGSNLWQHVVVCMGRVLVSLIAVNDQSSHVFMRFKGLLNVSNTSGIVITSADMEPDNLVIPAIFPSETAAS